MGLYVSRLMKSLPAAVFRRHAEWAWTRRIWQVTMAQEPFPDAPMSSLTSTTLHSNCTIASFTRGVPLGSCDGTFVKPEISNSSTSGGYSPQQQFAASTKCSEIMFTTHSPVAWQFASVSLGLP